MNKRLNFTVAIPTFNGAKTLPSVLEKLQSQTRTENLSWEVIVVDNNSSDNIVQIVSEFQAKWLPYVSLKYCYEAKQGLTYARQRAVKEASGEFIGFLDDDNLPDIDWVFAAYQFGVAHPKAGSFGGRIQGRYEVEPPKSFDKVKNYLAIRKYADQPQQFAPEQLRLPPGAGLVVRREAWLESLPDRPIRTHRGGNDYEISLHLHKQGWEIWYNPAMQIEHLIPAWRMEKPYLTRIARTYGLCTCEIRLIIAEPIEKPLILARSFLGGLRRTLLHLIKHRDRAFTDLGLACELSFFVGNIISPFYYLKKQILGQ